MTEILVVGAGIIGLNTALRLARETKYQIKIWAESDSEIASNHLGAFWWPNPDGSGDERLTKWGLESFDFLKELDDEAGVVNRKIISLAREPHKQPPWVNLVHGCRPASSDELTKELQHGFVIESAPVIDPFVHLHWLLKKLKALGVTIESRKIANFQEALEKYRVVVNCTGFGAKELCQDKALYLVYEQMVKIRGIIGDDVLVVWDTPQNTYVIPQGFYTMLGGTYSVDAAQAMPEEQEVMAIIARSNALSPSFRITKEDIIRLSRKPHPRRAGVRLELEKIDGSCVIHNYGQGSSGYSVAYGCAGEVVRLTKDLA